MIFLKYLLNNIPNVPTPAYASINKLLFVFPRNCLYISDNFVKEIKWIYEEVILQFKTSLTLHATMGRFIELGFQK